MCKRYWGTVSAAALLLVACNGQDTGPASPEATADPVSQQSASADTEAAGDTSKESPAPTPPDAEYANSRPPLDNSGAEATPGSCLAELGRKEAETLSEQCYAMSPATRPPCNIQNSCERIREELKRGCEFGDTSENPDYCSEI